MKRIILFLSLLLPGIVSASGMQLRIVFAANLDSEGSVHREDPSGADLFSVHYDLASQTILDMMRLTCDSVAIEWFPSLSPNGEWVAYNCERNRQQEIRLLNFESGDDYLLCSDARFPEWVDDATLIVSDVIPEHRHLKLLALNFSADPPIIADSRQITLDSSLARIGAAEASDAYPFPGGERFAFHCIKAGEYVSAVSVIDRDGGGIENLTDWEAVGHVIVSPNGQELVYSSAGNGFPMVFDINTRQRRILNQVPHTGSEMAAWCGRYDSLPSVHWTYAAWFAGEKRLIFSAQGANAKDQFELSRLYIVNFDENWENPEIIDLSGKIETYTGKSDCDFCTASARVIPIQDSAMPVIYATLVSHNVNPELSSSYPDYLSDTVAFRNARGQIARFAAMCVTEGARYNFESDWNFLMALNAYDRPMAETNHKRLLPYLVEDLGLEIEGTLHGGRYNWADIAWMISREGIEPNHTVGGFLGWPADSFQFDLLAGEIQSTIQPGYSWRAEILHAPSSYQHIMDDSVCISGIWKPAGQTRLTEHNANGPLICVGHYNGETYGLNDLLAKQENGELENGQMYTATIFLSQQNLDIEYYQELIRFYAPYVAQGRLRWVGLEEAVNIWQNEYSGQPSQLLYEARSPIFWNAEVGAITAKGASVSCRIDPRGHSLSLRFDHGRSDQFGDSIVPQPNTASGMELIYCQASLDSLIPNQVYHYRLRAREGERTYFGLADTFRTLPTELTAPALLAPADQAIGISRQPVFQWKRSDGTLGYHLQISAQSGDWSAPIFDSSGLSDTLYTTETLLSPLTICYWRVRGASGPVLSPWSKIFSFTTASALPVNEDVQQSGLRFRIFSPQPNPFCDLTRVRFELELPGEIRLSVFDISGRRLTTLFSGSLAAGRHEKLWNAERLPNGIYLLRLEASERAACVKALRLR